VRTKLSSQSAFSDLSNNFEVYERAVRVLIKLGRADEAFDYLSAPKSKKLQDSLRLS
jgi:hypothetical protein